MKLKDRYGFYKLWFVIVFWVSIFILCIGTLIGIGAWVDSTSCSNKAEIKGYDYEWDLFAGCVYRGGEEKDQTIEVVG